MGQHVLITGASSGIGAALAEAFAAKGYSVGLIARRIERLEQVAEQVRAVGGVAAFEAADVADRRSLTRAIQALEHTLGPCEILIANAGRGGTPGPLNPLRARDVLRVNFEGVVNAVGAVLPGMAARRRGRLVIVSSLAGARGLPFTGPYAASKAALWNYAESLRAQLGPLGITVTDVRPGYVDTEMTRRHPGARPLQMGSERAAQIILRGTLNGRAVVAFPWPTALAMGLLRAMPNPLYDRLMARIGRRVIPGADDPAARLESIPRPEPDPVKPVSRLGGSQPMIDVAAIRALYESQAARHEIGRRRLGRPLTLGEKILFAHLDDPENAAFERKKSFIDLRPDRVAMQDATAQMALLQFMVAGRDEVALPSTVHCDHLIRAHVGADDDLQTANSENKEVYSFLRSVSARYGLGFWKPGAGIIHQVVLENYAFPGGLMIGTDSHTPNAGGLGMVAVGVGGADAVDAMVGMPWEVLNPGYVGVKLTGQLSGWASPKDVILKVCEILTVKGGTNHIVEYFGPGCASISATGKGTICNMGAEHGATTSLFPFDERMATYLRATGRADIAALAEAHAAELRADPEVEADPERYYDRVVEIDLSTLEPHVVGPHTPDLARPISALGEEADSKGWPRKIKYALIGSCTNSSYEDIERSAHIARQAAARGVKAAVGFMITPGSDQIFNTIQRDGQAKDLKSIGGVVLANACGPCIGQWRRDDIHKGDTNSIITSFNRNFRGRNDANPATLSFIGSPELVTAIALSGDLGFNPLTDSLTAADGSTFKLEPPTGDELPQDGFEKGLGGFIPPVPVNQRGGVSVVINPDSERIEALTPFAAWDGQDFSGLRILVKAVGKCTTDHISAAGPWLKYRGHLTNISGNLMAGANNAWTGEFGNGVNFLTGEKAAHPDLARQYKAAGQPWVIFGDENYGEGSSREHAAMEPRHMGCKAVIVRSFARIHETNLKKQGVLPLTFADPADYDLVKGDDVVDVENIAAIGEGGSPTVVLHHADGTTDRVETRNTLSREQFAWFVAGSALNKIRADLKNS
ncbi:MAG: aconitate hydratase [Alphaproteobacteria bacterium]|nr:aconitate hydratase [Alphaproteobacteria bacterium]